MTRIGALFAGIVVAGCAMLAVTMSSPARAQQNVDCVASCDRVLSACRDGCIDSDSYDACQSACQKSYSRCLSSCG
jgi:hypothetical protein